MATSKAIQSTEQLTSGPPLLRPVESINAEEKIKNKEKKLKRQNALYKKILENCILNFNIKKPSTCSICLQKITAKNVIVVRKCNHYYCKGCIIKYILETISNSMKHIKCPDPKCGKIITHNLVKELIDPSIFEMYDIRLMNLCIEMSNDMTYCPKIDCLKICVKEDCSNKVNCVVCYNQFCFLCKNIYTDKNHICNKNDLLNKISKDIADAYAYNKYTVKPCPNPKCRYIIEKIDGCNRVTCTRCTTEFCWSCLMTYEHINEHGNHKCNDRALMPPNPNDDDSSSSSNSNSSTDDSSSY